MSGSTNNQPRAQSVFRRHWWLLPAVVLFILMAIIYVLSHLSAADSEMYPTTMLQAHQSIAARLC